MLIFFTVNKNLINYHFFFEKFTFFTIIVKKGKIILITANILTVLEPFWDGKRYYYPFWRFSLYN